jgi:hypothetical protein
MQQIKGTNFLCVFDKTMQAKNKVKQNNNKVNDWAWETPLAEIFFLPSNGARKIAWWRIDYTPLGTPRGRYDEHSSKSSLSCETKVYRTSRRKPNFRRWCLLALRQLRTIYKVPHPGLCFTPAATWNLHNTTKNFAPNLRWVCQSHRFAVNKGLSISSGKR